MTKKVVESRDLRTSEEKYWAGRIWQVLFNLYIEKGGATSYMNDLLVDYDTVKAFVEKKGSNFAFILKFSLIGRTDLIDVDKIASLHFGLDEFLNRPFYPLAQQFIIEVTLKEGVLTVEECIPSPIVEKKPDPIDTPQYRIYKDGDQWCAVHHDFKNLHESVAGFGATPSEALSVLLGRLFNYLTRQLPVAAAFLQQKSGIEELALGQQFRLHHDDGHAIWEITTLNADVVFLHQLGRPCEDKFEFIRKDFEDAVANGLIGYSTSDWATRLIEYSCKLQELKHEND